MAAWIGHLGGGLMLVFLALLVLRCARELGLLGLLPPFLPGPQPKGGAGPEGGARQAPAQKPAKSFLRGFFCRNEKSEQNPPQGPFSPGPWALAAAFLGVLALQWGFAFLSWLSLRQPGGLFAFFAHFWQRFTTAGDSPHYLLLARQGYAAAGENAKYIVFYPLYPLLIRAAHTLLAPFGASWELSALAVSQMCWGGAGAAMLRLAGRHFGRRQAAAAVLLMALYPFGFFARWLVLAAPRALRCCRHFAGSGSRPREGG